MSKTSAQNIIMGLALDYECGDPEYEALGMAWDALENNHTKAEMDALFGQLIAFQEAVEELDKMRREPEFDIDSYRNFLTDSQRKVRALAFDMLD